MDYEEMLSTLLGMVGEEMNVQVCALRPGEEVPHATVAWFDGVLRSGVDIRHPSMANAGEAMMFAIGDARAGFLVEPRTFESAGWWTAVEQGTFVINTAGVMLFISRAGSTRPLRD